MGLNTLVIPRKPVSDSAQQQPYVYLKCGHVQGYHDWGQEKDKATRRCPMCLVAGPIVKLCMGIEPAFYVDRGPPTYAFNPCGHMATEKTVKFVFLLSSNSVMERDKANVSKQDYSGQFYMTHENFNFTK